MTQLENRPIIQKGQRYKRTPRDTSAFMFPKDDVYRNPALLRLARGQNCTLMFNHGAGHDPATVVACHSNQAAHGKGKSMRAADCFIAFGCANCHSILDQGKNMTREQKELAFFHAMRTTRSRMFLQGLVLADPKVRQVRALSDDDYWIQCWRNGLVRVA